MADDNLGTYLNDHLAGASAALELLEQLESDYAGTPVEGFAAALRADVAADRAELEELIARAGVAQSRLRKAATWLAEQVTRLKMWADDRAGGELRLLESLDALALGIEGKRALWRALAAAAAGGVGVLQGVDYERLEGRAEEQRGRTEARRLEAARAAFGGAG